MEIIDAAPRGVQVRILLDYFNNYLRLDYLRAKPLVDEVERLLRLAYQLSAETLRGNERAAKRCKAQSNFL